MSPAEGIPPTAIRPKYVLVALLGCWAYAAASLFAPQLPGVGGPWPLSTFFLVAGFATLYSSARQRSLQNTISAVLIMGVFCFLIIMVPGLVTPALRTDLLGTGLCATAFALTLLNARMTARIILRPWRSTEYFGWWLMALAAVLSVLTFPVMADFLWAMRPVNSPYLGDPSGLRAFSWGLFALGAQLIAVPWLLIKRPGEPPKDYLPLFTWVLLQLLFAAAHALSAWWWVVATHAVSAMLVGATAVYSARWQATQLSPETERSDGTSVRHLS